MMQQYHEAKRAAGDALLLFRMGDFYELFFEDAKIAARTLGIALTSRDKGDDPVPMAGFPYHQLDPYLAKIIAAGHRAAICEQVEDPKQAKGLVKREVTRIVTPGTLTDDALLDPQASNYLAAVVVSEAAGGAQTPATSGRLEYRGWMFRRGGFMRPRFRRSRQRISWRGLSRRSCSLAMMLRCRRGSGRITSELRVGRRGRLDGRRRSKRSPSILERIRSKGLGSRRSGDADCLLALRAAGAVLNYLTETQKASLEHIDRLIPYSSDERLAIDPATRRSLEIVSTIRDGRREGSLLGVVDRTVTSLGARLLADWLAAPLVNVAEINARLDAVAELVADANTTSQIRESLKQIYDIQRLLARVTTGRASPRDLAHVGCTLAVFAEDQGQADGAGECAVARVGRPTGFVCRYSRAAGAGAGGRMPADGAGRRVYPGGLPGRRRRAARADGRRQAVDG